MNEQSRVETVEEFKRRIAAIVGGKPEQITGAPRPPPTVGATQQTGDHPEGKTSSKTLADWL